MCGGSCACDWYHEWGYIPSPCYDVIDERLVFCGFPIKDFCGKFVITICKFYELYGDFLLQRLLAGGGYMDVL